MGHYKLSIKTAKRVSPSYHQSTHNLMLDRVKTITSDNGKEFAHHRVIYQALGSMAYIANLFASWQRGSKENPMY